MSEDFCVEEMMKSNMSRMFEKGPCDLCGSKKGEALVIGLFKFLCPACFAKSEMVCNHFAKYLLTLDLKTLSETLERASRTTVCFADKPKTGAP